MVPRVNSYGIVYLPGLFLAFNPSQAAFDEAQPKRLWQDLVESEPQLKARPPSANAIDEEPLVSGVDVVNAKKELSALLLAVADLHVLLDGSELPPNLIS